MISTLPWRHDECGDRVSGPLARNAQGYAPAHVAHLVASPQQHVRCGSKHFRRTIGAVDLTTGRVIGRLHSRHRAIEFKQFLQTLDREVPAHLDVRLVLDNSSTRKTPASQRWLASHPRFVVALHSDRLVVG